MERFKRVVGWCWNHWGNFVWLGTLGASFALPAWAASVTAAFAQSAPFSWVAAGFVGMAIWCASFGLWAWAKGKLVRSAYDQKMLGKGGAIDPLEKTFERKRIYLNEFCLPSHPYIDGKTFIDCDIIGPANVILLYGNNVSDHKLPYCDAMVIAPGADPINGYGVSNCIFRGCSFQRVTLMFAIGEYHANAKGVDWLKWTSLLPDAPALALAQLSDETEIAHD